MYVSSTRIRLLGHSSLWRYFVVLMLLKSNFLLSSFFVPVPPKKPIIHDANGRKMTSTLGPYKVGEELIATCVTSAGKIEINVGELKSGKFMYNDILHLSSR